LEVKLGEKVTGRYPFLPNICISKEKAGEIVSVSRKDYGFRVQSSQNMNIDPLKKTKQQNNYHLTQTSANMQGTLGTNGCVCICCQVHIQGSR
jgi:hypothetical protein